jgi:hypothetical protein
MNMEEVAGHSRLNRPYWRERKHPVTDARHLAGDMVLMPLGLALFRVRLPRGLSFPIL